MKINIIALLILFSCLVVSINALRSIFESYNVGIVYDQRKEQIQQQYLQLIKKKNELDYINTPFFAEKQLRESLNYYKNGEKLVVFTQKLQPIVSADNSDKTKDSKELWLKVLLFGVDTPKL